MDNPFWKYFQISSMSSSVIRQKRESQNGGSKIIKHPKFSEKQHFLHLDTYTHEVRNVCFSENLVWFVFLLLPFWVSSFSLITDELLFLYLDEETLAIFHIRTRGPTSVFSWSFLHTPWYVRATDHGKFLSRNMRRT